MPAKMAFPFRGLRKANLWPRVAIVLGRFRNPRSAWEFHRDVFQQYMAQAWENAGGVEESDRLALDHDEHEATVFAYRSFPENS